MFLIPVLIAVILITLTCKDPHFLNAPNGDAQLTDTTDGSTRLVVGMHDAVSESAARGAGNGKNLQGIQALNLTVRQIVIQPSVNRGDVLRAEVFVLDSSGRLDTIKYEGALFMDSLTYQVR